MGCTPAICSLRISFEPPGIYEGVLLYGRDPKLPTEPTMVPPPDRSDVDYKAEVLQSMQEAWEFARKNIASSQKKQKRNYDRRSRKPTFEVGGRVFLYTPSAKSGPGYYHTKDHTRSLKFQKMLLALNSSDSQELISFE